MRPEVLKERPIPFRGPMVRAILEGKKTQTRRVIKPQPDPPQGITKFGMTFDWHPLCPYGSVGDRLWVREAWNTEDGTFCGGGCNHLAIIRYAADDSIRKLEPGYDALARVMNGMGGQKRPSIHMPRWASRITLEITEVRVQRAQEISIADALCEGITCPECGYTSTDAAIHLDHAICVNRWLTRSKVEDVGDHLAVAAFSTLWDSINGKKPGCSWADNPWIWALTFKPLVFRRIA